MRTVFKLKENFFQGSLETELILTIVAPKEEGIVSILTFLTLNKYLIRKRIYYSCYLYGQRSLYKSDLKENPSAKSRSGGLFPRIPYQCAYV